MDHIVLPKIRNPATPPIRVRYLCKEPYDGDGFPEFADYPKSKGWDVTEYLNVQYWTNVTDDFLPFLQQWLYFGMLQAVVAIPARNLVPHFVSGGYVTSKTLPRYLESLQARLMDISTRNPGALTYHLRNSDACLDEADLLLSFINTRIIGREDVAIIRREFFPEIMLSIHLLGSSLKWALAKIQQTAGRIPGPESYGFAYDSNALVTYVINE